MLLLIIELAECTVIETKRKYLESDALKLPVYNAKLLPVRRRDLFHVSFAHFLNLLKSIIGKRGM